MDELTLLQANGLNYLVDDSSNNWGKERKAAVDVQLAKSYRGTYDSLPFLIRTGQYLQDIIEQRNTDPQHCTI